MKSSALIQYLDDYLKVKEIDDVSCNGLQIEGKDVINRIGLAVDFSLEAAEEARQSSYDLLIVHHGMIWGGLKSITGSTYKRLKFMIEGRIGLYAAHLPLDMHREIGNNVELARLLGVTVSEPFGNYNGKPIGVWGTLNRSTKRDTVRKQIDEVLDTESIILPFGKEKIKSVGIVSGGGARDIQEAIDKNLDAFLTGESSHNIYHIAREAAINVFYAGHYATETTGLKALGKHLEGQFGLAVEWIDIPTGF